MDTADIVATLLGAGPLGAVIAAMGYALWRQTGELRASQEARVQDAQKVADMLLNLNDKWNASISELADAIKELKIVVQTVRDRRE